MKRNPTSASRTGRQIIDAEFRPVPRMAMEDLEAWGGGQLTVTITNPNAFRVGENLATRKGKVIFQNELM